MKKLLLFFMLLFTFVLAQEIVRQKFGKVEEFLDVEFLVIDEKGNVTSMDWNRRGFFKKITRETTDKIFEKSLKVKLSHLHSYIVRQTYKNENTSEIYYIIYYIMGYNTELENKRKTVQHVVKLWKESGLTSRNVTIIRRRIKEPEPTRFIHFIDKIVEDDAGPLGSCMRKRLFKFARSVEGEPINDEENQTMLRILQVPVTYESLNKTDDFLYECESKVFVFNMSGNAPQKNAERLAKFIATDKETTLIDSWDSELPEKYRWLPHLLFYRDHWTRFMDTVSTDNNNYLIKMEMFEFISGEKYEISPEFYKDGFCNIQFNDQQHYLMKNYDAREAVVYIGDEDDFKNIKLALIAGEELNVDESDETAYEITIAQKHNLSAPFLTAFYEFQKNFNKIKLKDIMRLLKKEISFGQAKYFPDEITEQSEEYYDNI